MAKAKAMDKRRYAPLGRYLRNLPPSQNTVTISFDDVETIIDAELPRSATAHHHQWWANQSQGSRAPHWDAAGFKVDHVELKKRLVRFARKNAVVRPPRPLTLQEVVMEVNEGAHTRRIEDLQEWRRKQQGMTRLPSATLFAATIKKDRHYAFHVGGLRELQFNVGFEDVKGTTAFRHGVAFSLQTTRVMPEIGPLVPKIARFNEYFRIYPDAFEGFSMWHWLGDVRSENYPVAAIPDKLVRKGMFIFIGAVQPDDEVDVDWILDDFDRLLPLYQYVEGKESFPKLSPGKRSFIWTPGNKARAPRTAYERSSATVDKSLRHNIVQAALFDYLESIHGRGNTSGEQNSGNGTSVDVAVKDREIYTYYELKTGLSAQSCIREAIGQLMEYSFWPGAQRAAKLVVVGEPAYDSEAKAYIKKLRMDFSLPIEYQQFDMKSGRLK
jgi:hypothetical protein